VATPPLVLPYNPLVTGLGEITLLSKQWYIITGRIYGKQNGNEKNKDFWTTEKFNLATWNVRGLARKEEILVRELRKARIDIAVISETKKKKRGSKEIGDYILLYSGVGVERRAVAGVGIMLHKKFKPNVVSYDFLNERILSVRIKMSLGYRQSLGSTHLKREGTK
jgi:hypothetical protein